MTVWRSSVHSLTAFLFITLLWIFFFGFLLLHEVIVHLHSFHWSLTLGVKNEGNEKYHSMISSLIHDMLLCLACSFYNLHTECMIFMFACSSAHVFGYSSGTFNVTTTSQLFQIGSSHIMCIVFWPSGLHTLSHFPFFTMWNFIACCYFHHILICGSIQKIDAYFFKFVWLNLHTFKGL